MYIESIPNRKSAPCILLREDHREGKKVVKKTLANLSKCPKHVIEGLRVLIKGGAITDLEGGFTITRSLPHGHVAAVLSVLKRLGLRQVIASRSSRKRDLVVAMIVARIIDPQSKLATVRAFARKRSSILWRMSVCLVRLTRVTSMRPWIGLWTVRTGSRRNSPRVICRRALLCSMI